MGTKNKSFNNLLISIILIILINIVVTGQVNVTFRVDMSVYAKVGKFDYENQVVRCVGDFNNWAPWKAPNMKDDGNAVYSITYQLDTNKSYEYKFLIGERWGADEAFNRSITVDSADTVLPTEYFNLLTPPGKGKLFEVAYVADMEFEIISGRFIPLKDTLFILGDHFGWDKGEKMTRDTSNTFLYKIKTHQYLSIGQYIPDFGFFYGFDNISSDLPIYQVTKEDFEGGQIFLEYIFGEEKHSQLFPIIFHCNTNNAASYLNNKSFDKVKTVHIAINNSYYNFPDEGWPNAQVGKLNKMYDDGILEDESAKDGIFSRTLYMGYYAGDTMKFRFSINFGDESLNEGGNDNEAGRDEYHFVNFPFILDDAVIDVNFGEMGEYKITEVNQDDNSIPTAYELEQNYPNPFNPTTMIRFSIPQSNNVTLKIYNMLGQEVAELINEYKSVGKYEVSFDASELSSGMYIYAIQAGDYVATKKMMLIK